MVFLMRERKYDVAKHGTLAREVEHVASNQWLTRAWRENVEAMVMRMREKHREKMENENGGSVLKDG